MPRRFLQYSAKIMGNGVKRGDVNRTNVFHSIQTKQNNNELYFVFVNTMVFIRKARMEDLPVLMRIGRKTLIESHGRSAPEHVMNSYVDDKFSEASLRKELADPVNIFHLVYYNGTPAGYSKIIYNIAIDTVSHPHITKMERLYLLEEFHGKNLGSVLMDFNVELSKQHQQAGIWLYVWKENHRAIRFYEKAGFQIVGEGLFRLTDEHANPNWQMFLGF